MVYDGAAKLPQHNAKDTDKNALAVTLFMSQHLVQEGKEESVGDRSTLVDSVALARKPCGPAVSVRWASLWLMNQRTTGSAWTGGQ